MAAMLATLDVKKLKVMLADRDAAIRAAGPDVEALNTIKKVVIAMQSCEVGDQSEVKTWWRLIEEIRSLLLRWHGAEVVQQVESDHLDPLRHLPHVAYSRSSAKHRRQASNTQA